MPETLARELLYYSSDIVLLKCKAVAGTVLDAMGVTAIRFQMYIPFYEQPRDKTNKNGMCAQRRLRSAWASAQSDQSLRCALNG